MVYKEFQDKKLSALGMGTMRLPAIDGDDSNIDKEHAFSMFDAAYERGINYYDTAWGYHSGNSELVTGEALKRYDRDSIYIATKFPGYDVTNFGKHEEIFPRQLQKVQTDYFDFYLLHNVNESNIDYYMNEEKYGTYAYFKQQYELGRIRHLGFSAHGDLDVMERFLERFGADMEFGQIQLNYLDYEFQDAKAKIDLLKKYDIPVWVMEPLRGGRLCNLTDSQEKTLRTLRPDESPTAWAFRFLQTLPEVTVSLSGMSTLDQINENIDIYEEEKPLNEAELRALLDIAKGMLEKTTLPCTACHYCTPHCPQELPIPELIALYNEHAFTGGGFIAPFVLSTYDDAQKPDKCIGCRSCEEVCPQQIKISEMMTDFVKKLSETTF